MTQLLVGLVIAAVVGGAAWWVERRRLAVDPPTVAGHHVPTHIDRADFDGVSTPWLVAVFSSATCASCADVLAKAAVLESDEVAVVDVEVAAAPDVHQRYRIDAVPTTVVVDAEGVVQRSFLGPVSATHLWAALAEVRDPGSVPDGCGGAEG